MHRMHWLGRFPEIKMVIYVEPKCLISFSWGGGGGWFNIKLTSYQYRKSHFGDNLISTMGFPILVRWQLYIESGPWFPIPVDLIQGCHHMAMFLTPLSSLWVHMYGGKKVGSIIIVVASTCYLLIWSSTFSPEFYHRQPWLLMVFFFGTGMWNLGRLWIKSCAFFVVIECMLSYV